MGTRTSRCKHLNRRGIFGDEINANGGARTRCTDCGKPLTAPLDPKAITGAGYQDTDALLAHIDEVLGGLPDVP